MEIFLSIVTFRRPHFSTLTSIRITELGAKLASQNNGTRCLKSMKVLLRYCFSPTTPGKSQYGDLTEYFGATIGDDSPCGDRGKE
jgi:hypothetical protein